MTPQEMYDAWFEVIRFGRSEGFERMCEQLRAGVLTMEATDEGTFFRAADREADE